FRPASATPGTAGTPAIGVVHPYPLVRAQVSLLRLQLSPGRPRPAGRSLRRRPARRPRPGTARRAGAPDPFDLLRGWHAEPVQRTCAGAPAARRGAAHAVRA